MRQSCNFELAHLNKKKEEHFGCLATSGLVLLRHFFAPLGMLFLMKTLEDEWYIVIKAYNFTIYEILRNLFCVLIYCMSTLSLHMESTDSMISNCHDAHTGRSGALMFTYSYRYWSQLYYRYHLPYWRKGGSLNNDRLSPQKINVG